MVKVSKRKIFLLIAILIFCQLPLLAKQNSNNLLDSSIFVITFSLFVALSINLFIRLLRLRKDYVNRLKNGLFNIFKNYNQPLIIFNNEQVIEFTNNKFKEIFNVNLIGKKLDEILKEADFNSLLKSKSGVVKFIDGTELNVNIIKHDIYQKKLYQMIIEPIDINKIFDKYHLLINSSYDGFYMFNSEAKLVLWNKGAEAITGFCADELFGNSFWDLLEKLDYDNVRTLGTKSNLEILFKQAIETGDIPELGKLTEKTIVDKNGELKVIQERCFVLPQNGTKYFCCSFRDFTERKKLEESLFESEKRFRIMFDSLPVTVFEANLYGDLTYLNNKGFELLDTNLEQFNQKINVDDLLDEENKQRLIKKIRENNRTGKLSYFLLNINDLKGKKFQIIMALNIFRDDNRLKVLGFADKVDNMSRFIAVQNESIDYAFIYNSLPYFVSLGRLKDQTFYEVNRAMVDFLGLNKSEIIGKNSFELKIFENLKVRKEFFNQILKNNEVKDFRFTYNHPELGKRLLTIDSQVVEYNEQKFLLSVIKDITALAGYLASLEESEEKYRSIFELSPDIIAVLQPDGVILDINQRIDDFTGISSEKIIGKNIFDFPILDEYDKKIVQSNFKARLSGKKVNPYKITLKHLNGDKKTVIVYGATINDEFGKVDKLIIIISDITELDKAQQEIKSKQLLLENITNTTPMLIYIFKYSNWEFLWQNKSVFELLGYNPSKAEKFDLQNFYEFIHPDDLKLFWDIYKKGIDISKGYECEIRIMNSTGTWSWISTKVTPFKTSENGEVEQLLGISYDITKQKETEEYLKKTGRELRELNATKDRFFTIISHDLRNPISSFLGLSELLYTSQDLTSPEIQAYGKLINDSANKVYALLENLLQWAKIQTEQFIFEPGEINLKKIVENIKMIFNAQLVSKNINLINKISDEINIYFDYNVLSTILRNLISNAVKYSHPNSEVIVSCQVKGKLVEISVQDFGVGMSEQVKNNLFKIDKIQSFKGTANEKGSGIGLLIIKDLLKSQNCEWNIISKKGEGTIFKFEIPLHN